MSEDRKPDDRPLRVVVPDDPPKLNHAAALALLRLLQHVADRRERDQPAPNQARRAPSAHPAQVLGGIREGEV